MDQFGNDQDGKVKVNSWNEWDPLKHVIVGTATGTMIQAPEPAVQRNWPQYGVPFPQYGPLPQDMVDAANQQLDNFADMLRKRGIKVDRPAPIDFSQKIRTPEWEQDSMFGCMPPRDFLLTVGNEILEAPMSFRSRWFEYLCYRPLLNHYYKEDNNFRWEAAPKPRLSDKSYKPGFWEEFNSLSSEEQIERYTLNKSWVLTEEEVMFDAADVARCGKDLFVQRSVTTNAAGLDWLGRHYPNHRVHEMLFREPDPVHIDATFLFLRPGLAMSNPDRPPLLPEMVKFLEMNNWEIVESAAPARSEKSKFSFCSVWLAMNVLMLDEKTVCVEAGEIHLLEQFDRLGFEVIPVPFWEVGPFGGGLHCATADVEREGSLQDYFPRQLPAY